MLTNVAGWTREWKLLGHYLSLLVSDHGPAEARSLPERPKPREFQLDAFSVDDVETDEPRHDLPSIHLPHQKISVQHVVLFNHSELDDTIHHALNFVKELWRDASCGEGGYHLASRLLHLGSDTLQEAHCMFALRLTENGHQGVHDDRHLPVSELLHDSGEVDADVCEVKGLRYNSLCHACS